MNNLTGSDPTLVLPHLLETVDVELTHRDDFGTLDRLAAVVDFARSMDFRADVLAHEALDNGATYQQIADALGITRQSAHQRYSDRA